MKSNKEFEQAIQSFPEEIKEIARQTRKLIYKVLPEVVEVVWIRQKIRDSERGQRKRSNIFVG